MAYWMAAHARATDSRLDLYLAVAAVAEGIAQRLGAELADNQQLVGIEPAVAAARARHPVLPVMRGVAHLHDGGQSLLVGVADFGQPRGNSRDLRKLAQGLLYAVKCVQDGMSMDASQPVAISDVSVPVSAAGDGRRRSLFGVIVSRWPISIAPGDADAVTVRCQPSLWPEHVEPPFCMVGGMIAARR
jgi:hypothetical protein